MNNNIDIAKIILIDEVFEVLTDNISLLSEELQEEFNSICYPIDNDMAYIIGDLIINEENTNNWEIKEANGNLFMTLTNPSNELKKEIFDILKNNNVIYNFSEEYHKYSIVE